MLEVVVIPAGAEHPYTHITAGSFKELQELVGGFLQTIKVAPDTVMFINKEGKIDDLPFNGLATCVAKDVLMPGDIILGNAVLIGVDPNGSSVEVSPRWKRMLFNGASRRLTTPNGKPSKPSC